MSSSRRRTRTCRTLLTGGEYANGLGPRGYVYSDLRVLQATLRLINERGEWEIPAMNRELVERATHPDALEEIVAELGAKWRIHANEVEGEHLADGLTAQGVLVRRDKSFYDRQPGCLVSLRRRENPYQTR